MIKVLSVQPDDILIGGVHKRSLLIAKELNKFNIQTTFLVAKANGSRPFSKLSYNNGFKCLNFFGVYRPSHFRNFNSVLRNLKWLLLLPISIFSCYHSIKKSRCSIIHINGFLNIVPLISAKIAGKKIIFHLIGDHYPRLVIKKLNFLLNFSDLNIFIANKLRDYYLVSNSKKNLVVFEPTPTKDFEIKSDKVNKIINEFNLNDFDYVIGNVANYTPIKGWDSFLQVAKKLILRNPNKKFIFICVGSIVKNHREYYENLQRQISINGLTNNIKFTGFRNDIKELIYCMDLFLMPSLNEGTPLTILESFISKTPVIASDVGGISEQIKSGYNGYLCDSSNIDDFINKSELILKNRNISSSFKNNSFLILKQKFSVQSHVKSMIKIYSDLNS